MVDSEIETSIRSAIVRSMELGLAVRRRSTGEIDEDSASRSEAMDRSIVDDSTIYVSYSSLMTSSRISYSCRSKKVEEVRERS